jgi:hypothetical protein
LDTRGCERDPQTLAELAVATIRHKISMLAAALHRFVAVINMSDELVPVVGWCDVAG